MSLLLVLGCAQEPSRGIPEPRYEVPWEFVDEALQDHESDQPVHGFVPDERAAIAIAEAVGIAQYGEAVIEREKPFRARLRGDIWTVVGTLPGPIEGGTALIQLSRTDGRILFAVHEE